MLHYPSGLLAPADEGGSGGGKTDRGEEGRISGAINADLAAEDAPGDRKPGEDLRERQEKLVDEAVEETFPASDPIAPKRITK